MYFDRVNGYSPAEDTAVTSSSPEWNIPSVYSVPPARIVTKVSASFEGTSSFHEDTFKSHNVFTQSVTFFESSFTESAKAGPGTHIPFARTTSYDSEDVFTFTDETVSASILKTRRLLKESSVTEKTVLRAPWAS